jgi:hypothetical protein
VSSLKSDGNWIIQSKVHSKILVYLCIWPLFQCFNDNLVISGLFTCILDMHWFVDLKFKLLNFTLSVRLCLPGLQGHLLTIDYFPSVVFKFSECF